MNFPANAKVTPPETLTAPTMLAPRRLSAEWTALPAWAPLPGLGVLAVNALLLKSKEPVLVDTGMAAYGDDFMAALENEIELGALRRIWISHADVDHIGNLARVLERAPKARIATGFLGMAKLALMGFDPSRIDVLQPGQAFAAGGRELHPLRPPYYDAPETTGFYDPKDGLLYVVDCFGAVLPAPVDTVESVSTETLHHGMRVWSSIDAPWLSSIDRPAFSRSLAAIERFEAKHLVSAHLPPLEGDVATVTRPVFEAYGNSAIPAPDAAAAESVLRGLDLAA